MSRCKRAAVLHCCITNFDTFRLPINFISAPEVSSENLWAFLRVNAYGGALLLVMGRSVVVVVVLVVVVVVVEEEEVAIGVAVVLGAVKEGKEEGEKEEGYGR